MADGASYNEGSIFQVKGVAPRYQEEKPEINNNSKQDPVGVVNRQLDKVKNH